MMLCIRLPKFDGCHLASCILIFKATTTLKGISYGATVVEFPSILVIATISVLFGRCNYLDSTIVIIGNPAHCTVDMSSRR